MRKGNRADGQKTTETEISKNLVLLRPRLACSSFAVILLSRDAVQLYMRARTISLLFRTQSLAISRSLASGLFLSRSLPRSLFAVAARVLARFPWVSDKIADFSLPCIFLLSKQAPALLDDTSLVHFRLRSFSTFSSSISLSPSSRCDPPSFVLWSFIFSPSQRQLRHFLHLNPLDRSTPFHARLKGDG